MPEFWTRPLATLGLFVFAALVAWAIVGDHAALFLLVLCLGGYLVYHLRQLAALERWLAGLSDDNAQKEYYLTDIVAMASAPMIHCVTASARIGSRKPSAISSSR